MTRKKRMLEMRACARKMHLFRAHARIFHARACNFCAFFGQIAPKRGVWAGCRICVSREAACAHTLFYQKRMRVRTTRLRRRTLVSILCGFLAQFIKYQKFNLRNLGMLINALGSHKCPIVVFGCLAREASLAWSHGHPHPPATCCATREIGRDYPRGCTESRRTRRRAGWRRARRLPQLPGTCRAVRGGRFAVNCSFRTRM